MSLSNSDYLRMCDLRINSHKIYFPDSTDLVHLLEVVRPDILSKMTEAEITTYNTVAVMTPAQLKAKADADQRAMEANRDKPSI